MGLRETGVHEFTVLGVYACLDGECAPSAYATCGRITFAMTRRSARCITAGTQNKEGGQREGVSSGLDDMHIGERQKHTYLAAQ